MPKSLADLRSAPLAARPEQSVHVCLRPDLVARMQKLTADLVDIPDEEPQRPRKMSEGKRPEDPRKAQIRADLEALVAEMAEHEGDLRVVAARSDGDWYRWCDEHPARAKGEPGRDRDERLTTARCNADDLLADLGRYVTDWNGEPLSDGDWAALFEPNLAPGDKADMASRIVSMYESRLDFQQLRVALSADLTRWPGSDSPEPSASPRSGSKGGSRGKSNAATTPPEPPSD